MTPFFLHNYMDFIVLSAILGALSAILSALSAILGALSAIRASTTNFERADTASDFSLCLFNNETFFYLIRLIVGRGS